MSARRILFWKSNGRIEWFFSKGSVWGTDEDHNGSTSVKGRPLQHFYLWIQLEYLALFPLRLGTTLGWSLRLSFSSTLSRFTTPSLYLTASLLFTLPRLWAAALPPTSRWFRFRLPNFCRWCKTRHVATIYPNVLFFRELKTVHPFAFKLLQESIQAPLPKLAWTVSSDPAGLGGLSSKSGRLWDSVPLIESPSSVR